MTRVLLSDPPPAGLSIPPLPPPRYKDLVRSRQESVHAASQGRVGYVHVPDMDRFGFAEFHRQWATEGHRPGLIVDLRGNAGGYISDLLLAPLTQRGQGWEVPRWGESQR